MGADNELKMGLIDNETVLGVQSGARKDGLNVGDICSHIEDAPLVSVGWEKCGVCLISVFEKYRIKAIRKEWMEYPLIINRFMEEAYTTAQLQHPGIISL